MRKLFFLSNVISTRFCLDYSYSYYYYRLRFLRFFIFILSSSPLLNKPKFLICKVLSSDFFVMRFFAPYKSFPKQ